MAEILYYENGKPKTAADFQSIPKNMDGFTWAETPGAVRRRTFSEEHGPYKKGDIIWLEPPTYETQTTPPVGGGVAYPYKTTGFMGKEITYSAQTNYRQYAVRLRALADNPRNPAEIGAVGTDWAVDEPMAVMEEGSNSNGSYVMYAGGKLTNTSGSVTSSPQGVSSTGTFDFPVAFSDNTYYPQYICTTGYDHVYGLYVNNRTLNRFGFVLTETASSSPSGRTLSGLCKAEGFWY